jgi:hypothetical protein
MFSRIDRIIRWLMTRDRRLVILVVITVVSLLLRWIFAIGAALGDDDSYASLAKGILQGDYPPLGTIGITEYRPAWFLPIAASVWLLGWTARGLVLYPVVTGAFLPLLTALWLRRHLPRESLAPVLCGIMLACYPTLFVDSLMLVNDTAVIFWCLLSVNLFGSACSRLIGSPPAARHQLAWIGFSLLAGATFAVAYQVKISAIPMLGIWLTTELVLQIMYRGWPERERWAAMLWALGVFLLPSLGVQLFYRAKTGHLLGNFAGEMRSYEILVQDSYFHGQLRVGDVLWTYIEQLVFPVGPDGFRVLLHGAWTWVTPVLGLVAGIFWRRLRTPERALAMAFLFCSIGLFLLLEFWPARLQPYYLPNLFNGRSWRYVDVLAPTLAACAAVILTLPGVFDRPVLRALRNGLLGLCFGVAGYGLVVRYHAFEDGTADYQHAAEASTASLASYFRLPQLLDPDGCGQFTQALGWPNATPLRSVSTHSLDLRNSPPVCIWTGGARRDGMSADASWSPERLEILGGDAMLIHTFDGLRRPWRPRLLQLWLFRPTTKASHELQPQP